MQQRLGRNTVVLLGVGHTNAHVLRMWKMDPPKNAQLICVSDFPIVTYSGMLPGVIAGQYPKSAMEIDLIRLAQSAGARVVVGKVVGLDHKNRELLFASRPPLPFDILSIGIGSRPSFKGVEVAKDAPLLAVKPMQTFMTRLRDHLIQLGDTTQNPKIVVVGGGVGSIEIAFCLHERFYGQPKFPVSDWPDAIQPEISIVTGSERLGTGLPDSTTEKIRRELSNRNVIVHADSRVSAVEKDSLTVNGKPSIDADLVIWATSAVGAPILSNLDLENDDRGFLLTKQNLEVTKLGSVFAVGDTGTIEGDCIGKAGVFAVRQGPVLHKNILNLIKDGKSTLRDYHPQNDFLKIINLGNNRAIAGYKGFSYHSRLCWKLKDHIDLKFMRMYQSYEAMEMVSEPEGDEPMRCLGCGGKIGSQILSNVLSELQIAKNEDVKIGLDSPDDAAIIATHGNEVTVTTDFFAAPFDDPYLVGRVAALNSASDCFVMGAKPTSALAIIQVPIGHPRAQTNIMREIMAGSVEEFNTMGAAIVGGHSIEGPRTIVGFTVLGRQLVAPTTKGKLEIGDALVLTKPIGTGVLLAAWMQCEMESQQYLPLIRSMLQSNEIALELIQKFSITALTDVTGFGLVGHLSELMTASSVSVEIERKQVPVLPGCQDLIERGIQSTLAPDNRSLSGRIRFANMDTASNDVAAMFDPQTGGGLLFGIKQAQVGEALKFLSDAGFELASMIGHVESRSGAPVLKID